MKNKDKSLAESFDTDKKEIRNPHADPQENYLEPEKDEPSNTFISADVKELEPVKPMLNENNESKRKQ